MKFGSELSEWIQTYSVQLVRLASMYSRDQSAAEDCVQDAFIKAYKAIHQLHQRDNPFPWLVRIVINECRTRGRKNWRQILTSQLPDAAVAGTEDTYFGEAEFKQIKCAVTLLPDKYKVPVILYYFEELPITEIAEVLQTNVNTVKTRLSRARKLLGEILQEEEEWNREIGRPIVESQKLL